jgi:hypothetical protein
MKNKIILWWNSLFAWSNWIDIKIVNDCYGQDYLIQYKLNSITNLRKFKRTKVCNQITRLELADITQNAEPSRNDSAID